MEAAEADPRLSFIGNYVQKALKLKTEKWTKVLTVTEYRMLILEFLDKPASMILIISQVRKSIFIRDLKGETTQVFHMFRKSKLKILN